MRKAPEWMAVHLAYADDVARTCAALAARGWAVYRFQDRSPRNGPLIVHRDPLDRGAWRMTHFLDEYEPRGHCCARTLGEALRLAHEFGADLSTVEGA